MSALPASGLTLPEELLLLAHGPADGKRLAPGRNLQYGLAGAVLAELQLHGLITHEGGRPGRAAGTRPADPRLAQPLADLPAHGAKERKKAHQWIRETSRQVEEPWLLGLLERQALTAQAPDRFAVIRGRRYVVGPNDLTAPTRQRFEAARQAGFPDPRSQALAALVSATGVAKALYPGWGGRSERKRLRGLRREAWIASAVYRNVLRDSDSGGGSSGGGGDAGGHGCGGHGGCGGGCGGGD
ncbi:MULTISPECIES: GOLPH3/VPS74 family protein [Streptomyces]|uniref:GPP34 family phosphoprotein n=1 Tax=Streptomyces griseocarneus TaxID=51201 RepID=A0ABX7RHX4_9ACTN|nr:MULTISPECIES: GPP34 family phosphoprotein [Streptomyces]QSY47026.1 GPP34 family phosphoprotein [Streptomyces griseocarneus]